MGIGIGDRLKRPQCQLNQRRERCAPNRPQSVVGIESCQDLPANRFQILLKRPKQTATLLLSLVGQGGTCSKEAIWVIPGERCLGYV